MWLFTKYGFYSAVCARTDDGRHSNPIDPNRVMVRARVRAHLTAILERFPEHLDSVTIHESLATDYAFRLFVDKGVWSRVVAALADELDYDNFKSAAAGANPDDPAYERSLHDVWAVMNRLQSRRN